MVPTAVLLPEAARPLRTAPAPRIQDVRTNPPPTELDARAPTPPQTWVAVVAALEAIPPGTPQYVRTSAAPIELLRELSTRGVQAYPRQLPDGSWRTLLICGDPARLRTPPRVRRG